MRPYPHGASSTRLPARRSRVRQKKSASSALRASGMDWDQSRT